MHELIAVNIINYYFKITTNVVVWEYYVPQSRAYQDRLGYYRFGCCSNLALFIYLLFVYFINALWTVLIEAI